MQIINFNNATILYHYHWLLCICNCALLTSVYLPENFTAMSIQAFARCSNLSTINALSFYITTFDNSDSEFRDILIKAAFSNVNPKDFMLNQPTQWTRYIDPDMYHALRSWARVRGVDSRLPLFTASSRSLKWSYLGEVFITNMPVVNERGALTGLPPFIQAATGTTNNMESIYCLLKECPGAIIVMNNVYRNSLI